jgi:predicted transcriptional regulator
MLSDNPKYDKLLPKHQKKIMLCLAKNQPMTMSETNKKLKAENTSTTRAFHDLEKKNMVIEVGITAYRGRKFSNYWLTERGVAFALINGANSNIIETISSSLKRNMLYFQLRSISPKVAKVLDMRLLLNGAIKPEELLSRTIDEVLLMNKEERERFLEAIKLSGEFDSQIEDLIQIFQKMINGLQTRVVKNGSGL